MISSPCQVYGCEYELNCTSTISRGFHSNYTDAEVAMLCHNDTSTCLDVPASDALHFTSVSSFFQLKVLMTNDTEVIGAEASKLP